MFACSCACSESVLRPRHLGRDVPKDAGLATAPLWGWKHEETRKVPNLWCDSFPEWSHHLALAWKHQFKRLRSILNFPGVVFAYMTRPGSHSCIGKSSQTGKTQVCSTDTKICKITDIGPGPRIDKGVNFPGLPRHDGQHAREEMPCHLPSSGEHQDGGTYLFTGVPRRHWQQRHKHALRLLSTIARGHFLLNSNQLISVWAS